MAIWLSMIWGPLWPVRMARLLSRVSDKGKTAEKDLPPPEDVRKTKGRRRKDGLFAPVTTGFD
ncbi:hypothetical protein [Fuscovulum blasticum]|uniref:hypothetical protein n=1 Tax=Fuscovulum blasticum TaxID=1075 RepID=UPI000F4FB2DB|nr:hypothetical protein [Fuscovulum blasticum]